MQTVHVFDVFCPTFNITMTKKTRSYYKYSVGGASAVLSSTADELSEATNIDYLERPGTPTIGGVNFRDSRLRHTFQD